MIAALALAVLLTTGYSPAASGVIEASGQQGGSDESALSRAVQREWSVRARALAGVELAGVSVGPVGLDGAWEELDALLEHARWEQRVLGLEVLLRALSVGTPLAHDRAQLAERVAPRLSDPHPDVRAWALQVWSWFARDAMAADGETSFARPLSEQVARVASADRLPRVRRALVGALEVAPGELAVELWTRLASDSDRAVKRAARAALFARTHDELPGVDAARAAVWRDAGDERDLLELARSWSRHGMRGSAADLRLWRSLLAGVDLHGRRGSVEAALLTALAAGAEEPQAHSQQADDGVELARWSDAWPLLESLNAESFCRERARVGSPRVAQHFVRAALAPSASEEAARSFFELAADANGAEKALASVLRSALPSALPSVPPSVPPSALTTAGEARARLALETLGPRVDDWGAGVGADEGPLAEWLALRTAGNPALRRALLGELAAALFHESSPPSAQILLGALEGPDDGRPFRALAEAKEAERYADSLLEAWRRCAPDERLARLSFLPREPGFAVFRAELLALGDQGGRGRALAAEHLQAYPFERATAAALARWLRDESERLFGAGGDAMRVGALARALERVDPAASPDALAELLARLARSDLGASGARLAEVVSALLARTPAGRDQLLELRAAGTLDAIGGRAQVVAALGLAPLDPDSEGWLLEHFGALPPDLETRALEALARSSEQARGFLREFVVRDGAARSLRTRAHEALAPTLTTGQLAESASASLPPEVRRVSILALGKRAAEQAEAGAALGRLASEWFTAGAAERVDREAAEGGPEDVASDDLRALLREAYLLALGRTSVPAQLEPQLWPARDAAARRLEQRLRSAGLGRIEIERRGELALASSLAREGRLSAAMHARRFAPGLRWWECDARFLAALARSASSAEPATASVLAQAALLSVRGESEGAASDVRGLQRLALHCALAAGDAEAARALARGMLRQRDALALGHGGWNALAAVVGVAPDALRGELERLARP